MSSYFTSLNQEITAMVVQPCVQNVTQKIGDQVLLATPTGKWARRHPYDQVGWSDYISDLT